MPDSRNNEGPFISGHVLPLRGAKQDLPTDAILFWTVRDRSKGADKLTLTIENADLRWWDNPIWIKGNTLRVSFGYPSHVSVPRKFKIRKVTGFTRLTVEAYGRELDFHAKKHVRSFQSMRVDEAVQKLASENGFNVTIIQQIPGVKGRIQQTRQTDAQFIQQMADRYGYEWFIRSDSTFVFQERDFDQAPIKVFKWRGLDAGSEIIGEPKVETSILNKPGRIRVVAQDHKAKRLREASADNESTPRTALGDATEVVADDTSSDGRSLGKRADPKPAEKLDLYAWQDLADMTARSRAEYKLVQSTQVKMTLEVIGDPFLKAKALVLLENFGVLLSGLYYVVEAKHRGGAGYTTTLKLRRNAMGRVSKKVPKVRAKVNRKRRPDFALKRDIL